MEGSVFYPIISKETTAAINVLYTAAAGPAEWNTDCRDTHFQSLAFRWEGRSFFPSCCSLCDGTPRGWWYMCVDESMVCTWNSRKNSQDCVGLNRLCAE